MGYKFTLFVCLWPTLCFAGQEVLDETRWPPERKTLGIAGATGADDSNYSAILQINGTAARPWPSYAVQNQVPRTEIVITGSSISCNGRNRGNRELQLKGKSGEGNSCAVLLKRPLEDHRSNIMTCRDFAFTSTAGNVNFYVANTGSGNEAVKVRAKRSLLSNGGPIPRLRQIEGAEQTGYPPLWRKNAFDDMSSSNESPISRNEESSSLNRHNLCLPLVDLEANDWNDRAFNYFNCAREREGRWFWRNRSRWKWNYNSSRAATNKGHGEYLTPEDLQWIISLSGTIQNDGSFEGNCIITDRGGIRDYRCDH